MPAATRDAASRAGRVPRAAVVLVLAGLVAAGCGSGDHTPSAAPTSSASSSSRPASTATGRLDACRLVTTSLLDADLGVALDGGGASSPSFFGQGQVTDCAWFDAKVSVTVDATDDAARDLPDSSVQGYLAAGGTAVPGADRGVAYATTDPAGSAVALIVVRGDEGFEIGAASDSTISQAQAIQLGGDVAAALG